MVESHFLPVVDKSSCRRAFCVNVGVVVSSWDLLNGDHTVFNPGSDAMVLSVDM